MCAPVLSLPRHNSAMYGMRDGAQTWRAGQSERGYFMQQPLSPYGGVIGVMPHCPFGGVQATSSWGMTDWVSGGGAAAPPILATSPSSSRKHGATQRLGHPRPQSTSECSATLIPGMQPLPNEGWEQHEVSRPAQPHHQRAKQRPTRSGPSLPAALSPRTSERDQPNTARSSYVDTASGSESARLSLKPLICEDAGDLYGPESPVRIRNTFLDSPLERSPSLERFFEERKVRSCPASGPHSRQGSNSSLLPPPISEEEGNDAVIATPSGSNSTLVTPRAGSGSQLLPLARRGAEKSDPLAAAAVQLAKDFETKMSWADEVRQDCLELVAAELLPAQPGVGADDSSSESSTTELGYVLG